MKATVPGVVSLLQSVCPGLVVATAKPGQSKGNLLLVGGVVGILGGLALLAYGLAPVKQLIDVLGPTFSGGAPPDDLSEQMDAAFAKLKSRALVDGLGFVALVAGFILVKQALAKPKPKSVEALVEEEVARRMAAASPTLPPPPPSTAQLRPAPAPPPAVQVVAPVTAVTQPTVAMPVAAVARRTHCAVCSSVLVAGGRLCPRGHAQA